MKRIFDIVGSLVGLAVFSLPMIVLALVIRAKLGTPVLFRQSRPGKGGQLFTMYKFRTMKEATDASGRALPDEDRMTPLGNRMRSLSLDELPEFFNVLKGNMSLVGPRPLLVSYLGRYTPEQARRHEVKPGITGWAQVNGRNAIGWDEKFKLDVWYVDHMSFLLDLKILWLTLAKVVKRDGIAAEGSATMPEFLGTKGDTASTRAT